MAEQARVGDGQPKGGSGPLLRRTASLHLIATGIEPIWFGVLCVLTIMIGQVTPPFGEVVLAIKGAVPEVPMTTVTRGVWPFVTAMVIALVILVSFPQIALLLPNLMKPV